MSLVNLFEMQDGETGDFFALLVSKEAMTTRDGKPYFRVGFRDARREVNFPVWGDSPWAVACRDEWTPGEFYKLRAAYRDTNYGPQLEIRKIRPVSEADADEGFDPGMCLERTRFDPQAMFDELMEIVAERITDPGLRALVESILSKNREQILASPAARQNHHAYVGGLLEHTLSVTRTAVQLADKYDDYYPDLEPRLDKGLVAAGAILHDVGKLRELAQDPTGTSYTPSGELIGHILQGRDLVREAAAGIDVDADTLLRLEHLIIAHQRLPEWGSPKPPMTPEALLVHYADDVDAKYQMVYRILRDDTTVGPLTSKKNILRQRIYRGEQERR